MRILMWTPTYGDGPSEATRASVEAQEHDLDVTWYIDREQTHRPPDHRNVLASYWRAQRRALAEGFDALLTVEHDMVLPRQAVTRLAGTPGDVVYGVYLVRWGTYVLNTFEYIGDVHIGESLSLWPEKASAARRAGVMRVSGAGWGCTLIKRKALETVELPESCAENPAYDAAFAQRALQAGLRMNANFRVLCGHRKGGRVLMPFDCPVEITRRCSVMVGGQRLAMYRRVGVQTLHVTPTANMRALVDGISKPLVMGQVYEMPYDVADDLCRARLVREVDEEQIGWM